LFKSAHDWDLLGEKEPGLGGRRLYLPRGKMIGGCSSINAMIYLRGNRLDFDDWAAGGAGGWSYDEVLPYFKRAEDNERGEDEFHGVGGPLAVSESRSMQPLVDAMLEAAVQAGYERIPDLNVDRPEGVARFQVTQRNGKRCSTADAYLHPVADRPNLEVRTSVFAQRIVFEGNRAVGVEVVQDGKVETIRAEREVIVSAGTYQSPVLLMLSGIGPAEDLSLLGIPVRENLPVGGNLQDHCMVNVNFTTDQPALFGILTPRTSSCSRRRAEGRSAPTSPRQAASSAAATTSRRRTSSSTSPRRSSRRGLNAPTDRGYAFGPVLIKPNAAAG
jgi:choline dehydrogenase-like flavoprotein